MRPDQAFALSGHCHLISYIYFNLRSSIFSYLSSFMVRRCPSRELLGNSVMQKFSLLSARNSAPIAIAKL